MAQETKTTAVEPEGTDKSAVTLPGRSELKVFRSFEEVEKVQTENDLWNDSREFPSSVQEMIERGISADLDRKSFLTFMGASLSMAALAACKEPVEKIVPYVDRPMEYVPGQARFFATTRAHATGISPMLVKSREGKPIKLEGLASHSLFKGAMTADAYASIWDLYDPDRLKHSFLRKDGKLVASKIADVIADAKLALKQKTVVIGRLLYSPSEEASRARLGNVLLYDASGTQSEIAIGNKKSYGAAVIPSYRIDQADLILSLEADFLGTWLSPELYTKQFSSRRTPDKKVMNRLVVAEAMMSLTGANADSRLAIAAGSATTLAYGLAALLLPSSSLAGDGNVRKAVQDYSPAVVAKVTGLKEAQVIALAEELKAFKGRSLVLGGSVSSRSDKAGSLQIAVNLLNTLLGNEGKTVSTKAAHKKNADFAEPAQFEQIVNDILSGKIETVVVDRANPVYDLPGSQIGAALKKAKKVIFIGDHLNDTAEFATHVIAQSHYLESWSDAESLGAYGITQPLIRQLFDTLPALEIYGQLVGVNDSAYDQIKRAAALRGNFDKLLSQGFTITDAQGVGAARAFRSAALLEINPPKDAIKGYALNLIQSVGLGEGAGANISFRHELPDPITKITWDNILIISPADAKNIGLKTQDLVRVQSGKSSLELPVFVQPGVRKGSMALAIGFGQKGLGKVAEGVGKNAFILAPYVNGQLVTSGISVTIEKIGKYDMLASTQRHYEFSVERGLARQVSLDTLEKALAQGVSKEQREKMLHPHEEKPHDGKAIGLYEKHRYDGLRWNMNIDLNKCTGCSACVVACYSENNIPAVGKSEINRGREMSWLRIDRYYFYEDEKAEQSDVDYVDPEVFFQPVMCQHCENAPCENVCPVGATGHSDDGLNYMTYNRCIGTRYCSNNCPYKVRRYNWFENWEGKLRDPQQYALNPDVTVRSRGVIEKCSFCQQRIAEKRQEAKVQDRPLRDGEIKTACQESCPADAIVFGNINSADTAVVKANNDPRKYAILAQINVEPAVKYMVRVKNRPRGQG